MNARPLRVLIAADDRSLLRHLSRFLSMFGYEVREAGGVGRAVAAMQRERPDFLLLDESLTARVGLEFCRTVNSPSEPHVCVLWMVGQIEPPEIVDALEAGVDDFLAKPLSHGEVLARLRSGARILEHERRAREQIGKDQVTGLLSRSAFHGLAAVETADAVRRSTAGRRSSPISCVVFDFDFFGRVRDRHGREAERQVLRAAAVARVPEWSAEPIPLACFGGDRFAVLLPNFAAAEAAEWADQMRVHIRETEFRIDREAFTFTASFGVAEHGDAEPVDAFIGRAISALETAKESGRDYVARAGEASEESGLWESQSPQNWFERTVARDVMTPCTVWLRETDTMETAAALLAQTGAPLLPVVNHDGRLAGCISASTVHAIAGAADSQHSRRVGDNLEVRVWRESENTPFAALMERFNVEPKSAIVVVENSRPTGIVTLGALAALSERVSNDTFAAAEYSAASHYLRVADYSAADADEAN